MKKIKYIIPVFISALIACGGGGETAAESEENGTEATEAISGAETNLSDYGMPYSIVVPDAGSGEVEIMANDWGGVEIVKGEGYMMSIAYGEGDLDLLKFDMEEDLVYKSTIIEEGENFILYKREIPDSGMDPEYHFMVVFSVDGEAIELSNMKDMIFSEEAVRNMLNSAKTFKASAAS
jgi:hypothetical protein